MFTKPFWKAALIVGLVLILAQHFCCPSSRICVAAESPLDKGSEVFAISAAFVNASGDLYELGEESFTAILLMPQMAHFVIDRLALGVDLMVLLTGQGDNKSTSLAAGPKLMYFFGRKDAKTYPYFTTGVYYLRNDVDYQSIDFLRQGVMYGTRLKFGAGLNWLIHPHLSLVVEASYNADALKHEDLDISESGGMAIISLGLAGWSF